MRRVRSSRVIERAARRIQKIIQVTKTTASTEGDRLEQLAALEIGQQAGLGVGEQPAEEDGKRDGQGEAGSKMCGSLLLRSDFYEESDKDADHEGRLEALTKTDQVRGEH